MHKVELRISKCETEIMKVMQQQESITSMGKAPLTRDAVETSAIFVGVSATESMATEALSENMARALDIEVS